MSTQFSVHPDRCQFTRAGGRRCLMLRAEAHPALCSFHASQLEQLQKHASGFAAPRPDVSHELASLSGEFKTAADVNHTLQKLFVLYAQGRVDRKDAMGLAYIAQLMLQTIPIVRKEMNLLLDYDLWRDAVKASFGLAAADGDDDDADDAGESVRDHLPPESPNAPTAPNSEPRARPIARPADPLPASRAELAQLILARFAERNGLAPPNPRKPPPQPNHPHNENEQSAPAPNTS